MAYDDWFTKRKKYIDKLEWDQGGLVTGLLNLLEKTNINCI